MTSRVKRVTRYRWHGYRELGEVSNERDAGNTEMSLREKSEETGGTLM